MRHQHPPRIDMIIRQPLANTLTASLFVGALLAVAPHASSAQAAPKAAAASQEKFVKPSNAELKKKLTPIQYEVTQHAANTLTASLFVGALLAVAPHASRKRDAVR